MSWNQVAALGGKEVLVQLVYSIWGRGGGLEVGGDDAFFLSTPMS